MGTFSFSNKHTQYSSTIVKHSLWLFLYSILDSSRIVLCELNLTYGISFVTEGLGSGEISNKLHGVGPESA